MSSPAITSPAVFVTGTDTGVGKTWVTTRLITLLRLRGVEAMGMKPIECGSYDDSKAIHSLCDPREIALEEINPIHLDEPLAPIAVANPVEIDFSDLKKKANKLRKKSEFLVIEGAGGWLVPLDEKRTVADLAESFGFPVLVVASNRLGMLNHTLLTVRAIRERGLDCLGVFVNTFEPEDLSQRSNVEVLEQVLEGVPVFDQDLDELAHACRDL